MESNWNSLLSDNDHSQNQSITVKYSPLIENDNCDKPISFPTETLKKKRDDLQCWRTIAILGVVVFHVWPTWFPNGFVGVDIFFVLSGFLMATIIHKHDTKINLSITMDFYFRRIKRIVPVYLFVLLIVLLLLFFSLWEEEFDKVRKDAYWALGFVSNEEDLFEQRDYFDIENNFKYFKHCWSLAAEMQFYLIVPVLFMFWLNFWTSGKFFILILVFVTSVTLQIVSASEIVRYESMILRIWQFTVGIAAQSYELKFVQFSSIIHNIFVQIIFLFCLVLTFCPVAMNREVISILCVISSGFLIAVSSSGDNSPFNIYLMKNLVKKGLVYCGDFSYILYLVHWPLITYCRFIKNDPQFSTFEGSMIILACFMLAIVAHHLIENPLINYCDSFKKLLIVTSLLYSFTFVPLTCRFPAGLKPSTTEFSSNFTSIPTVGKTFVAVNGSDPIPSFSGSRVSNLTFEMLRRILKFDDPLIVPEGWSIQNEIEFARKSVKDMCGMWNFNCHDTYSKWTKIKRYRKFTFCESSLFPNENYTAVVIGNSHSQCGAGAIHLNPLFKTVLTASAHAQRVPIQANSDLNTIQSNNALIDIVKNFKPDLVFFISSYNGDEFFRPIVGPMEKDHAFMMMDNMIKSISPHTKGIIMNLPNFQYPMQIGPAYERSKRMRKPIDFRIQRKSIRNPSAPINLAYQRMEAINCPKCLFWDYQDALCGDNYCNPIDVDTGLPLLRDYNHINILGLRRFRPILDKLTRKALNLPCNDRL